MSKSSDEYRAQAKKARKVADAMQRNDMRRTALDIAQSWEHLADMADGKPQKPEENTNSLCYGFDSAL